MRTFFIIAVFLILIPACNQQEQQAKSEETKTEFYEDGRPKFRQESTESFMNSFVELDSSANSTQSKAKAKN
ncbi:hypothetical protein [Maridesulfovibrio sp.]|uniref:hypothetical protein n=1 Tax=Maridesulfovibrio sp. TaxID=2795000 RepID=UPI0029F57654|nr:hypothetical protein [Maridesulfovibrio sp.]